jgi:asparagine synthase (glutamine-hydrolysing)
MCGIVGKLCFDHHQPVDPYLLQRMMDRIVHRGPDGEGTYVAGPVGLGHRRLSIIDVTAGAQPMSNEDRTVWITFNGEIYNYRELRQQLLNRGHRFATACDTEVIVHLWEDYGVDCVQHLRGMFALGLWDAVQNVLFLARDRIGIKPLYYAETPQSLVFASEIKALLADPEVNREVSLEAVDRFLTYQYLPGTVTLFSGVRKLEPGHYLLAQGRNVARKQYWDLRYTRDSAWRNVDEAADALASLLRDTVRDHMVSDVPIGFLASGGIDSTALLSYAVDETQDAVQTFTVGFSGPQVLDERPYARLAAEHFGTRHHEITISAKEFCAFLPDHIWYMEEPMCEPPAVALYYVSSLARQHVKVLLSGEGGDEAFGGYPEYRNYLAFEHGKSLLGSVRGLMRPVFDAAERTRLAGRAGKYRSFVHQSLPEYYYSRTSSPHAYFNQQRHAFCADAFASATSTFEARQVTRELFRRVVGVHPLNQMLYVDAKSWLPDELLVKADKMTMAASVELRVPFLDHRVLEFAATLPAEFKVRGHQTKRVLRHAFRRRVPRQILKRKKAGFPVPYAMWLRDDLREFVHDTLLSSCAVSRGYFCRDALEALIDRAARSASMSREVFSLIALELWHLRFVDDSNSLLRTTAPVLSSAHVT